MGVDMSQDTDKVIVDMLTENTGAHMLDSGGAYGRHWEENQEVGKVEEWKERPETTVDIYADSEEVIVTSDIFHYLRNHIERTDKAKKIEEQFYELAEQDQYKRTNWNRILDDLFGGNRGENTYNRETHLGQVLQYTMISEEEAEKFLNKEAIDKSGYIPDLYDMRYIFLQIHNGCDVRGGYTKPRVFEVPAIEYFLAHQTDIYASCECSQGHSDDAGYHWYDIPDFEFIEVEDSGYGDDKVICSECGHEVEFYCPMAW